MDEKRRIAFAYAREIGGQAVEIDFERLEADLKASGMQPVRFVEIPDPRSNTSLGPLPEMLRAHDIDAVVLAAGPQRFLGERLLSLMPDCDPSRLGYVDLVAHCCRTCDEDHRSARALALVRMAFAHLHCIHDAGMGEIEVFRDVLVVGSGTAAEGSAVQAAESGCTVILVDQGPLNPGCPEQCSSSPGTGDGRFERLKNTGRIRQMTSARLDAVTGCAGRFDATVVQEDRTSHFDVGAIIVATGLGRVAFDRASAICSLSQLEERASVAAPPRVIGVVADPLLAGDTHGRLAVRMARDLASEKQREIYVFLPHVPVRGEDGHRTFEEALRAGVMFFRTEGAIRLSSDEGDGAGVHVRGRDMILDREFDILCDLVAVADPPRATSATVAVADGLGLPLFGETWMAPGNVTFQPVQVHRRGMFAAGTCAADMDERASRRAGVMAGLEAATLLSAGMLRFPARRVSIDEGKCISCLTCVRVCPVSAIRIEEDRRPPVISDVDCRSCGTCASSCPQRAIEHRMVPDAALLSMARAAMRSPGIPDRPVLALCCQRSGMAAFEAAGDLGLRLPHEILPVALPCAGLVSTNVLLALLNEGLHGLMVVACPEENCRNRHGSHLAQERVTVCRDILASLGEDPRRISFNAVASNMPYELAARCREVVKG